jgi:multicomponent Na+:H+ antiporter subunit B
MSCVAGLSRSLRRSVHDRPVDLPRDSFGVEVPLSSVMLFDIGVYLVVVGAITSIALALEEREVD